MHRSPIRLFLVLFSLVTGGPLASAAERLPNIVILYADDMGYGDVAVQNPDSKIPTPNLDRLASEGLRFTDAHSSSGICTPSRYALLTGRFHWRKFHDIVNSFDPPVFSADELTLPKLLKQQGYRTACIGKWHLGWNWSVIQRPGVKPDPATGYAPDAFDWSRPIPGGPLDQGFDYYFGDDVPNFPPYTWFENDRVLITPTQPLTTTANPAEGAWEARPGPMAAGWDFQAVMPRLTERAVEWIGQQRGNPTPFFLYFPFTSPHAPIVPASEFVGRSQAGGYGDYVAQTDATVGAVLQALEDQGLLQNTLVIFTADNGPEYYAYERVRKYQHRSAGPLRGLKRDLWEGGHRVPFIVRWSGRVAAGTVHDALISQVDILATLAAITGCRLPARAAEDSYDLSSVWQEHAASPRRSIVHNTLANGYAIRHDQWLLVAASSGAVTGVPPWFDAANGYGKNDQPGALYDLSQDLAQRHNLYSERPDKVAELQVLLEQIRATGQVR
ncbi:MAG: sulfatase family protein [Pirellulaceae bacterium]